MNKLAQSVGHENLNLKVVGSSPTFSEVLSFTGSSDGKESTCNAGNLGSIPGLEVLLEGTWQSTPVFLPGESHGQRSLAGHKESDTTE